MAKTPVRVLVVDDFEPFRQLLSSTLQENSEFQVVSEVADGLRAVEEAAALKPDLILLDIGLPTLNGIEAARRIRTVSPNSRILFFSQESSAEVVRRALSTGAMGYVVKSDAGAELFTAVRAVLRDESFLGQRFAGQNLTGASNVRRHQAQFYCDDAHFLHGFTQFIVTALSAGNAVILVATESHRDELLLRLQGQGPEINGAIQEGRYISLDAAKTLSTFMVDNLPDRDRFLKSTGDLIVKAAKSAKGDHPVVAACGECAPLLWAQGNVDAAIRLEQLWNEVARAYDIDILCGYVLEAVQREQKSPIYENISAICAEHSGVMHIDTV